MEIEHEQVLFVDYFGNLVEVDAELIDVLNVLRDLGVRTDFSCQGDHEERETWNSAYILSGSTSIFPLFKNILKLYFRGSYSKSSKQLIRCFFRGKKETGFRLFGSRNLSCRFEVTRREKRGSKGYVIDVDFSTEHGFRTCVRWPPLETSRILLLLQETETNIT